MTEREGRLSDEEGKHLLACADVDVCGDRRAHGFGHRC